MTHTQRLISIIKLKTGLNGNGLYMKHGILRGQISKWENGANMGFSEAIKLCETVGLKLSDVLLEMSTSAECKRITNSAMDAASDINKQ